MSDAVDAVDSAAAAATRRDVIGDRVTSLRGWLLTLKSRGGIDVMTYTCTWPGGAVNES